MNTTKRKLKLAKTRPSKAETVGSVGRAKSGKRPKWDPPKSQPKRRAEAATHGDACFLTKRRKRGAVDYGYPICNSAGRVTCQGTQAAFRRANMQGDKKVASAAKKKARQLKCGWAVKRRR